MPQKNIGGQAVIEGVMLRDGSNGNVAVANRLENGEINVIKKNAVSMAKKNKFFSLPLIRGVVSFIESLVVGTKTLMDSAEVVGGDAAEEYEPSKFERFLSEKLKIKLETVVITISVILGLALALVLFTFIPTLITGLLRRFTDVNILLSLCEGIIKVIVFILYIFIVSKQKDIKRVFQYHGAEHKTINCYEADMEVTVENVRGCSRIHPRCGTSFMFFVMVVSILLFSLISWDKLAVRILLKILLMPVVAGVSYEIIRFSGKTKSKLVHALVSPGLMLQKITTAEPDDSQIEVGIASLKALTEQREDIKEEAVSENASDASCECRNTDVTENNECENSNIE